MGTNYYRVPLASEMEERKLKLIEQVQNIDAGGSGVISNFCSYTESWNSTNVWDNFIQDVSIHLGKRSSGWQFNWDHNDWKYYKDPEEMLKFIRSGRVFDEYGSELPVEEFIEMAKNWTGLTHTQYYEEQVAIGNSMLTKEYYIDIVKDGFHYAPYTDFS